MIFICVKNSHLKYLNDQIVVEWDHSSWNLAFEAADLDKRSN